MQLIKYGGAVTGLEEERAIIRSIHKSRKSRNWQTGEEARKFEQELCEYLGVKHTVLTSSGSCAGLLALMALELSKDSEVIISAVTFPTIYNIILQCGLRPVVVDAELGTYNFNLNKVEQAITSRTSAIIAIHVLGNPVDLPRLQTICKQKKLKLILDNCDGLGTTWKDKKVETYVDVAFTSFHAAHIVSMGVGGGIFTNDKQLAHRVRMYRDWGRQADINKSENLKWKQLPKDYNPRFIYEKIGYNFQILELQAAMGRVQLRKIEKIKRLRKKNFDFLYNALKKYSLIMPRWAANADICWFAFPLSVYGHRDKLLRFLEKRNIETRPMFAGNILAHPAYNTNYRLENYLWSEMILTNSFWISCHPSLTQKELNHIVNTFHDFFT